MTVTFCASFIKKSGWDIYHFKSTHWMLGNGAAYFLIYLLSEHMSNPTIIPIVLLIWMKPM